jgi:hypothetical protein
MDYDTPAFCFSPRFFDIAMSCPVCGCQNVHPVKVLVNPAGNASGLVEISIDGLSWDKTIRPDGRGVRIELSFACEAGHAFTLEFHFHKGGTYTAFIRLADVPIDANLTIWRD